MRPPKNCAERKACGKRSRMSTPARFISERPENRESAEKIGTRGSILAAGSGVRRKQILQATEIDAEISLSRRLVTNFSKPACRNWRTGCFHQRTGRRAPSREIDLAVHSVKDVPTDVPSRLYFPVIMPSQRCAVTASSRRNRPHTRHSAQRRAPRHSSLRRQAQIRHARPDLDIRELRGNVDTRLRKVDSGEYDAILLAKAGLDRLGLSARIAEVLEPEIVMPAVGQGAIGVQARVRDEEMGAAISSLDDFEKRASPSLPNALF